MTSNKPWLLVAEPDYFRDVIGSMIEFQPDARKDPGVVVRFGLMGDGIRPNYQFEAPPDRVQAYKGSGHKPDANAPANQYRDHELSAERFTFPELQSLLRRCLDIRSGKQDPSPQGAGA